MTRGWRIPVTRARRLRWLCILGALSGCVTAQAGRGIWHALALSFVVCFVVQVVTVVVKEE